MSHSRRVLNESFSLVGETCPDVEEAMERATQEIKKCTIALRDALNETIERAQDAEDKVSDLEDSLSERDARITELQDYLAQRDAEIKELQEQLRGGAEVPQLGGGA